jgi:hypothetical protein
MINASAIRNTTNSVRARVQTTEPYIQLMARIEQKIVEASENGEQSITINVNLMLTYANHKLPGFIDRTKLKNVDEFWWSFVWPELTKNGYKINNTKIYNEYEVSW